MTEKYGNVVVSICTERREWGWWLHCENLFPLKEWLGCPVLTQILVEKIDGDNMGRNGDRRSTDGPGCSADIPLKLSNRERPSKWCRRLGFFALQGTRGDMAQQGSQILWIRARTSNFRPADASGGGQLPTTTTKLANWMRFD